jgi:acetyl-CoA acetyltransferase
MLSVYLDGELPSPWKEKLENHLALCGSCRDRLEAYREMSRGLKKAEAASAGEAALEAAKDRVRLRLQRLETGDARRRPAPGLWRRSVSIPLPAAAAAAVILFIALAALWFRQNTALPPMQDMAAAGIDLDVRGIVPVSDMHGVLQYLGDKDTGDIVILRLPESRNFMSSGEPTILKAADLPPRIPLGPPAADYSSGRNTPR